MSGALQAELVPTIAEEVEGPALETAQPASRAPAFAGNQAMLASARASPRADAGEPIPRPTRERMESRFGRDFSDVRVHHDAEAARESSRLGAEAFTVGRDIYFAESTYDPGGASADGLLAHELTHTEQQRDVSDSNIALLDVTRPNDPMEREAEAAARSVEDGRSVPESLLTGAPATRPIIARQQDPNRGGAGVVDPQQPPGRLVLRPPGSTGQSMGGTPGSGLAECARRPQPLGGRFNIESASGFETQARGELEWGSVRRLRHHRVVQLHTDDGIEATLTLDATIDLPLSAVITGPAEESFDVRGVGNYGYTVIGHTADGTPIAFMGLGGPDDNASMREMMSAAPEFAHMDLTYQRQIESLVEAIRCTPVTERRVAPSATGAPQQRTEPRETPENRRTTEITEEEFDRQTPDERREFASRSFWDEFSIPNILIAIGIGLIVAGLAIGALLAAAAELPALALALAGLVLLAGIVGIGFIIWQTITEILERWEHEEYLEAFLIGLRGFLEIAAIVIGGALLVIGVIALIIGLPFELSALAIAGIILLGVAIILITLWIAYNDYERAVGSDDLDDFRRSIKKSARGVERAISDGAVLIITIIAGQVVKWVMGRGRLPIADLPPEEEGHPPGGNLPPPSESQQQQAPPPAQPQQQTAQTGAPPPPTQETVPPGSAPPGGTAAANDPNGPLRVLRLTEAERRLPQATQQELQRSPRAIDPERTARMRADLQRARRSGRFPARVDEPGEAVEGGTLAIAETDIPALQGRRTFGASPNALPEGMRGRPGTTGGTVYEPANPTAVDHAEHVALENMRALLRQALADGTITPEDLRGRTVFVMVEQEPCSSCGSTTELNPGVIQQFSADFPALTVEVRSPRASRVLIFYNGTLQNP